VAQLASAFAWGANGWQFKSAHPDKMDITLYDSLLRAAYRFLSYRPRSEKELLDFLQKKLKTWKVAGKISVNKTINRLRELGYVDDRRFVDWWILQRSGFRPKGRRAITAELMKKGIAKTLIESVFSDKVTGGEFDEYTEAQKVIRKKIVLWCQMPAIEQKKKVYTYLAQRGFSFSVIEKIIDGIGKKDYN
jgi:regulatory protein